jgi:hypothetical protein
MPEQAALQLGWGDVEPAPGSIPRWDAVAIQEDKLAPFKKKFRPGPAQNGQ